LIRSNVMADPDRRIRWITLLLGVAIVTLGCIFILRQRREERLWAALALYKSRSHERVVLRLRYSAPKMDWPDETPLGEVIEQIKLNTRRDGPMFPLDVPIVIDPVGLEAAGRSLRSPIQRPPLDQELSLGKKLQTVLKPLGLACQVKDATIVITSERMVDEPSEETDDEEE
jgi:hypothetical protein